MRVRSIILWLGLVVSDYSALVVFQWPYGTGFLFMSNCAHKFPEVFAAFSILEFLSPVIGF